MKRLISLFAHALLMALALAPQASAATVMTVFVDATDAHRGVFHAHLTVPATGGPLTVVYPKWIPGEHMPTGPLTQVAGLHIHAGDAALEWWRDRIDMFSFHVDVPTGRSTIEIDLDYLSPSVTFGGGYGESANATQNLLLILFNHLVLYPSGIPTDSLLCRASVRLPSGWKFDTALPVSRQEGDRVDFDPVSLTTLVDSPIVAGAYLRTIPIADSGREHVTIVADSSSALAMPDSRIAQVRNLVAETDALFGARHYRSYRWLVTLSDLVEPQGLEHHESTDIRAVERGLTDPDSTARTITILSHEFVHSWNGKYRRPAGLATPDYQAPMIGELLFVYEGMTRYLGDLVLSARSGMRTPEEDREYAAWVAANQDKNRPGRTSRALVDTAVGVAALGAAPNEEVPYRRALDYYDESMLLWLDVDTTIRARSGGTRSLDDFAKLFFGPPAGVPMVKPYTLDEVASALNQVVPNDWRAFIEARVYRVTAHPPLGALEASGWRLVYSETPNWYQSLRERTTKQTDASFTLGMWVKHDGTIADVVYQSAAYAAGLMPGMKITAIDGRKYGDEVLDQEIDTARGTSKPIDVTVEQGSFAGTFHLDYHEGRRFPHLQRIDGKADLLTDIMRPREKR
jgi:predicted metalloprotease with PDZ domain